MYVLMWIGVSVFTTLSLLTQFSALAVVAGSSAESSGNSGGSRIFFRGGVTFGTLPSLPFPPLLSSPFPSPHLPSLPSGPIPSLPLPSSPIPSTALPLEVGFLNPVRGSGGAKSNLVHFSCKIWHLVAAILIIFLRINLPKFVQLKQY